MRESKRILWENDIKVDSIIYPFFKYNDDTLEIVRKYYKYAFARDLTWKKYHNLAPVNQYNLQLIS